MASTPDQIDPSLDLKGVANFWIFRVRRMQFAHYLAARRYSKYRLWLGCTVILLGAVVGIGTTAIASMEISNELWVKVVMGTLSVISAVVAGIQTFLNYPELSEKNRVAGAKFANLKHKLELLVSRQSLTSKQLLDELAKIEKQWAKLRSTSPNLPLRVWDLIEKERTMEEFDEAYINAKMRSTPIP